VAVVGAAIGVVIAMVIAPVSGAQVAVEGASVNRGALVLVEERAAAATVLVKAQECQALTGTGTVLRSGLVVTNAHVLGGGSTFDLVTAGGSLEPTGRAQRSTDTDVATGAAPDDVVATRGLELAAHDPRPGDQVVIAGHPGGGPLRVRTGSVVGARPGRGPHDPPTVIRLDLHLLPGESGSPVVGLDGRLVGIAYSTEHGSDQALVIPVSQLRHALGDVATATRDC
jgi:putative serine protease PepD